MIITSVYSETETNPAFVRLKITDEKKIVLLETWQSKPQGGSIFVEINRKESESVLFNGTNIEGKLHSFLCESAKLRNIKNSQIAKPYSAGDGLAIFRDIEARMIFSTACDEWNTLSVELNRLDKHRTGRAMAFLQAIIAADKEVNRQPLALVASEADRDRHLVEVEKRPDEVFYIGVAPAVLNPAMTLIGLGREDHVFTLHDSFYEPTGAAYTTDDILQKCSELISRNGVQVKRIFIPDDRPDLVKAFRNAGFRQAITVKGVSPSQLQRAEILNTLLKCDRFRISAEQPEFFGELLSYHRATDKDGNVLEDIAQGQADQRINSALYGIGRLVMDHPRLMPIPQTLIAA